MENASYLSRVYKSAIPKNLVHVLNNESVKWAGKPERIPYLFLSMISAVVGMYILLFFSFIVLSSSLPTYATIIFIFILLAANSLIVLPFFYRYLSWSRLLYIITSSRMIIRGGEIRNNIKFYQLANIEKMHLDIEDFIDQLFEVGTIDVMFNAKEFQREESLEHLKDYDHVFNLLKRR